MCMVLPEDVFISSPLSWPRSTHGVSAACDKIGFFLISAILCLRITKGGIYFQRPMKFLGVIFSRYLPPKTIE